MMAREHACGSIVGFTRGGSLWNRTFFKGAYSRPFCSTSSGGYKRGLYAFQCGQRHHGRSDAPKEEHGGGGAGGSDVAVRYVLR